MIGSCQSFIGIGIILAALLDHLTWIATVEKLAESHSKGVIFLVALFGSQQALAMLMAFAWALHKPVFSLSLALVSTIFVLVVLSWGHL